MNQFLLSLFVDYIEGSIAECRLELIHYSSPLLVVTLARRSDRRYLTVITATPGPFCFLGETDPLDGCGGEVLRRVYGARISQSIPVPQDRVLRIPLVGEHSSRWLAIYLFGSSARVRVETAETVIDSTVDRSRKTTSTPLSSRSRT